MPDSREVIQDMFTQVKNERILFKWFEDIIFEYLTLERLMLMTKLETDYSHKLNHLMQIGKMKHYISQPGK